MSVLVVGSVALDTVRTKSGDVADALGGSASYFSLAARRFAPVSMVAVVGEDFPAAHVDLFRKHGVDVTGLETAPGRTFRWTGVYAPDFRTRETLDTQLNVFADFDPKLNDAHREAAFVFLANIHPELQGRVREQIRHPRLVVLDTMNYWIGGSREALLRTMRNVDVMLLNDEEAEMLTGTASLDDAARAVLDLGPDLAVVKRGEDGARVVSRDFAFSVPACRVDAVRDPTGAGDTFAGGFVGYLASREDPQGEEAIRSAVLYGAVLASFTVESFSLTRLAAARAEEIETRFREIQDRLD
jgi:sugar/nucleoside kinase (ribokinase family)